MQNVKVVKQTGERKEICRLPLSLKDRKIFYLAITNIFHVVNIFFHGCPVLSLTHANRCFHARAYIQSSEQDMDSPNKVAKLGRKISRFVCTLTGSRTR